MLKQRQYRTDQPCGDGLQLRCPQALDENATLTGSQQEQWLFQGLNQSLTRWNIIAQQVMFAQFDFDAAKVSSFLDPLNCHYECSDGGTK